MSDDNNLARSIEKIRELKSLPTSSDFLDAEEFKPWGSSLNGVLRCFDSGSTLPAAGIRSAVSEARVKLESEDEAARPRDAAKLLTVMAEVEEELGKKVELSSAKVDDSRAAAIKAQEDLMASEAAARARREKQEEASANENKELLEEASSNRKTFAGVVGAAAKGGLAGIGVGSLYFSFIAGAMAGYVASGIAKISGAKNPSKIGKGAALVAGLVSIPAAYSLGMLAWAPAALPIAAGIVLGSAAWKAASYISGQKSKKEISELVTSGKAMRDASLGTYQDKLPSMTALVLRAMMYATGSRFTYAKNVVVSHTD